jgi:hypothetical protein
VFFESRFERRPDGGVGLRLPSGERALLRSVGDELKGLLEDDLDAPDLRRLFPPVDAKYDELVQHELLSGRRRALETLVATLEHSSLTAKEAEAWLTTLNVARLVLGTRLDVTEETDFDVDPTDPRAQPYAVYVYLTWLQEQLIEALAPAP